MALENNRLPREPSSVSVASSLRAMALVAMGALIPSVAQAQPHRHRHSAPTVAPATNNTTDNTCDLLAGNHTTQEWLSSANSHAGCLDRLLSQRSASDDQDSSTERDAQRLQLADRILDAFGNMADAYAHALTDASDLSLATALNPHDLHFNYSLNIDASPSAWQRLGARMLQRGNAILAISRRPGITQEQQRVLTGVGMQFHLRVISSLTTGHGISDSPAQLTEAKNHTSAEWVIGAEEIMRQSRVANARIGEAPSPSTIISSPNPAQRAAGDRALDYYLQAVSGYMQCFLTASDRSTATPPNLNQLGHFEPRINYSAGHWFGVSNVLNFLALALDTLPSANISNGELRQRVRFELLLRSVEATQQTITSAVSSGEEYRRTLPALQFNVRQLSASLILMGSALPDLPRVMPPNAVPAVVNEVQAALSRNNTRRRVNLERIVALDRLSLDDKRRVRVVLINWATILDAQLASQEAVLQTSLRPIAHQGMRVCDPTTSLSGENLQIVRSLICQTTSSINFANFVNIATNPTLVANFPSHLARSDGRPYANNDDDLHHLGLTTRVEISNGQAALIPFTVVQTFEEMYHCWYLLHFAHFALERLDREIAVESHTEPLISTIRLAHNPSQTASAALGELTATDSVSHAPIALAPISVPGDTTPVVPNRPVLTVDTAQQAFERATAARNSRVNMWRIIGLSAAGVGAITLGTGWGLSAANASEAQDVPNTPANRALHAEIEQIRGGVYHTQAEVDRANQRLEVIHTQFLTSVNPYQNTASTLQAVSYVGLGVMIAGGTLAALAPVLAGSPPAQPSPGLVPSGGRQGPHPATTPGSRAENDGQGNQFGVAPLVTNTTVGLTATGTF